MQTLHRGWGFEGTIYRFFGKLNRYRRKLSILWLVAVLHAYTFLWHHLYSQSIKVRSSADIKSSGENQFHGFGFANGAGKSLSTTSTGYRSDFLFRVDQPCRFRCDDHITSHSKFQPPPRAKQTRQR